MKNKKNTQPTEGELEILQTLWRHGPSTVRFINDRINEHSDDGMKKGYTTTLKLMQIMTDKGILARDARQRSHLYRAVKAEQETQGQLLDRLLHNAFGGSSMKLVMQALGSHKASNEEISRIRELLDKIEGENQ